MMKGGYFLRITLVVFQIEKFSEADSFQTLSPPPVSKHNLNNLVVLVAQV